MGIDTEGDETVVGVIGQGIEHHGENHDDVLSCLLHGEEGDDIVAHVLPAEALEQDPADAQLQGKADEETANEQQELTFDVILGLEDPVAVPQETIDNAQDIARDVGDTIRQAKLGIEQIECDECDERVQHAYHAILEQLYARLAGFGLIYLHYFFFIPISRLMRRCCLDLAMQN